MKDIFEKDISGEMVSPNEPGYEALIADIFDTMKTTTELVVQSLLRTRCGLASTPPYFPV